MLAMQKNSRPWGRGSPFSGPGKLAIDEMLSVNQYSPKPSMFTVKEKD
jgi:hypothetical protein